MKGWTLIKHVILLVIASPFVALNVWGAKMSIWSSQVTASNNAHLEGRSDSIEVPNMPASPLAWFSENKTLRQTFSADGLNLKRTIKITDFLDFEDVLKHGEPAPQHVMRDLYVAARLPNYAMRYCDDVIATIGYRCVVLETELDVHERDNWPGKKYRISATLGYAPNYDFGTPSDTNGAELENVIVYLVNSNTPENRPLNTETNRRKLLNHARSFCDELRDQYGACVVSNVGFTFTHAGDRDGSAERGAQNRMQATASLAVHGAISENRQAQLRDQFNERSQTLLFN